MPVIVPKGLPAIEELKKEYIYLLSDEENLKNKKYLDVAIVNLMPKKIETERQFLRLLDSPDYNIKVDLITAATHKSKNTSKSHIDKYYKHLADIKRKKYDGMIITGAPIENLKYEQVDYWQELTEIMDFTSTNVSSTIFICWAAMAGLYHFYDIPKYPVNNKIFGIFEHKIDIYADIIKGFDDVFYLPQSRHTTLDEKDVSRFAPKLKIITGQKKAGPTIISEENRNNLYMLGHIEYEDTTLADEYFRDVKKGLDIHIPINYFPQNDPKKPPITKWKPYAKKLFDNWINYYLG